MFVYSEFEFDFENTKRGRRNSNLHNINSTQNEKQLEPVEQAN